MKKFDLSKLRISTKRDWIIFWVFALFISYAVADRFQDRIDSRLRRLDSPWMWYGNEPHGYGRMIAAVVIFAVVAEAVCFLCRKQIWMKLSVLAAGILIPLALAGIYQYNCRLIVSVIWEEYPQSIIFRDEGADGYYTLSPEEQTEFMELCRKLTIVSDKQKEQELMERYQNENRDTRQELDRIELHFGEKYGHSIWIWLYAQEDHLFFDRGYGSDNGPLVTFYEDNGLIQFMENLK